MTDERKVVPIDMSRMRKGMRQLARDLILELSHPDNSHYWDCLPSTSKEHVNPKMLRETLGSDERLKNLNDSDASSRITHLSVLALHAVATGQYRDKNIAEAAIQVQAAAERVKTRLLKKAAFRESVS